MTGRAQKLSPGDFWRICDRSGMKVPASQTRKEWTGEIVDRRVFEQRHPQEFVRGRVDQMAVPDPRPRPIDTFVGPLTTKVAAAASAGAVLIEVESSVRFVPGDQLLVMLADGETFRVLLQAVPDASHLVLALGLPGAVTAGAVIVNQTAVAAGSLP